MDFIGIDSDMFRSGKSRMAKAVNREYGAVPFAN
jgi:hypothetical protein